MDRYYTSIPLFHELFAKQTVAVGTCMANRRGLPKDLVKQRLPRGKVAAYRDGALLALKWRDKRDVLVLSTKHTPAMQDVSVRAPGGRVFRRKPILVEAYNSYMGGVDKSNQLLSYYRFNRKTNKWWKKLFFHLLSLAVVNAQKMFNLYKTKQGERPFSFLTFTESLLDDLLRCTQPPRVSKPIMRSSTRLIVAPDAFHGVERISCEKQVQRVCVVCAKRRLLGVEKDAAAAGPSRSVARRTIWWCPVCKVALCFKPCFKVYHTKENYWK